MRMVFSWLLALVAVGCGGSVPGPAFVPVSGVVTLDGKGVEGATVTFAPKTEGSLSLAMTDAQGNFTLKSATGRNGAAVGEHNVTVVLSVSLGGPPVTAKVDDLSGVLPNEAGEDATPPAGPSTKWIVPERYSKPGVLSATVPAGGLSGHKLELVSQ